MKKIIVVLLLCATPIFGQQNNTITVVGKASKKFEIEKYIVHFEFRELVADGYQNVESKKRAQIIEDYKNKLKKINIDFEKFERNRLLPLTTSAYARSSYYEYTTTSFEEVENLFGLPMQGVTITWVEILTKKNTNSDLVILDKTAINDAKNRANTIANGINKKIGDIQKIETLTDKSPRVFNSSKPHEFQKHYVKVTFTLE